MTDTPCPTFVDNRNGNTMATAINSHLSRLLADDAAPEELCIATGYFNAAGWFRVAEQVEQLDSVRLLLGAEPTPATEMALRMPEDPSNEERERQQVHQLITAHIKGLKVERDRGFPFTPDTIKRFKRLREFFRSEKVQVRRFPNRFFHAKAWLFRGQDTVVGSSNLTAAGLTRNLELNLGHHDPEVVSQVETWFDEVWEDAEAYDLAAIYADLFRDWTPYEIYLRVLLELYGAELEEDDEGFGRVGLTNFQKHGIWRAKRILQKHGGVIVADGVGLGKTFTAGGLMEEYKDRRQRILLIRPAALKDTWDNFLAREFLGDVDRQSYEALAMDSQLADADTVHHSHKLKHPIDEYQLVVIDEAHNYRNPDARTRAGVLRRLLRGQRRDLVMLTATPVNNSLLDLYHLLRFFLKQDSQLADQNIQSLKGLFDRARRENPEDLNPDLLFPVIDATTVKRTRSFIKKHYPNDKIPAGPNGEPVQIHFPKPIPKTVRYQLDEVMPGFMDEFEEALRPAMGRPKLTMARYQPELHLKVNPLDPDREGSLVGLLRSGLLKRCESSAKAFANTCRKMAGQHEIFLQGIDGGVILRKDFFKECSAADDFDADELIELEEHTDPIDDFDADKLRQDVEADMELLIRFAEQAEKVTPQNDPKLEVLAKTLAEIAKQAKEEGVGEDDERDKRKVVIFSFFKDTAKWVHAYLRDRIESDPALAAYKGRLAATSGTPDEEGMMEQDEAVSGFAPKTAAAASWVKGDLFDVLIATDVLAEGVNLQQARHVINYDMPWNPMRLVQRHGRIDRLFSEHKRVYVRTFFPDAQVDRLLNLESRVRDKLALAAASVGQDETPIEDGAKRDQAFSETRREIEKIQAEDPTILDKGGTDSAAQTGEEYRADLRKALDSPLGEGIKNLPWKAGSGMVRGDRSGHFFCAKVGNDRTFLRFVPEEASEYTSVEREIGTCLRRITCEEDTGRYLPDHSVTRAYEAWTLAQESVWHEWDWSTDPANLQPRVPPINRQVNDFILTNPPEGEDEKALEHLSDTVLGAWNAREQNQIRTAWDATYGNKQAKSKALCEAIRETGIEPAEHPTPLPSIELEDIKLICWMAIQAHDHEEGSAT